MTALPERLGALERRDLPGGLILLEARTFRQRSDGLSKLDALPAGHALHIAPCRSIHMFGMRFALDLVWLGRDGEVVRVDTGVRRRQLRACLRARSVVECNAGEGDAFAEALRAAG